MKTTIIPILALLSFNGPVAAQRLRDIPAFTPEGYDVQDYALVVRGGDGTLKPGEYVVWKYSFPWNAIVVGTGERIPLVQDKTTMIFESATANTVTVSFPPTKATISKPKNIEAIHLLFSFADVSIHEASKDLIVHRLGRPARQSQAQGEDWFLYSKTVTRDRTRYVTERGEANGTIDLGNKKRDINLETVTRVPVEESITYQPYSFKVHFNEKGFVSKVEDLTDRTITWKKK